MEQDTQRVLQRDEVSKVEPLLVPVLREGRRLGEPPSIESMRKLREEDMECLDPGVRRIMNPHLYHVSLTGRLRDLKKQLVQAARSRGGV